MREAQVTEMGMKPAQYHLILLLLCTVPACSRESDSPESSVDPEMSIEPDTSVEPQIREMVPEDSVDPEMVQPPEQD